MSVLKIYNVDNTSLHDMCNSNFYLKSEADKVIEELKAQKAQAEDDCAYWKMREGNAVNAMHETEEACMYLTKSERHQKYKRCLEMAERCEWERRFWTNSILSGERQRFQWAHWAEKWRKRWLTLADKYKEGNV